MEYDSLFYSWKEGVERWNIIVFFYLWKEGSREVENHRVHFFTYGMKGVETRL